MLPVSPNRQYKEEASKPECYFIGDKCKCVNEIWGPIHVCSSTFEIIQLNDSYPEVFMKKGKQLFGALWSGTIVHELVWWILKNSKCGSKLL